MAVMEKETARTQAPAVETPSRYQQWQAPLLAVTKPDDGEQDETESAARYRRARARVEELKGFYTHAFMYVLVNAALLGINLVTSSDHLWFFWVTLGWGVGLVSHAFVVYGISGLMGKRWEDQKIREFMERDEYR